MTVLHRVVRRETHSPRTAAMVVAVVVLALVLAYIGVEIVLALASQPALLLAPAEAAGRLREVPLLPLAPVVGVAVALVGVVFIVLALTPGRLPKHRMDLGDRAVIVDNGVVAAALAQRISDEAGIARERITVGVAHRAVDVTITPDAGITLDEGRIRAIADEEIGAYQLAPPIRTVVKVTRPKEPEIQR